MKGLSFDYEKITIHEYFRDPVMQQDPHSSFVYTAIAMFIV